MYQCIRIKKESIVYQTINGWTKESMKAHIIANFKGKSVDIGGECLYRGPNEAKCAVGLFIPDSLYHSCMEQLSPKKILNDFPILADKMPLETIELTIFQMVHDESSKAECLPNILKWIDEKVA